MPVQFGNCIFQCVAGLQILELDRVLGARRPASMQFSPQERSTIVLSSSKNGRLSTMKPSSLRHLLPVRQYYSHEPLMKNESYQNSSGLVPSTPPARRTFRIHKSSKCSPVPY